MLIGEQSWRKSGPSRTWIVGLTSESSTYHYNATNIAWPMKEAYFDPDTRPYPNNDKSLGSEHAGGAHAALADGSVQFLSDNTALAVLQALASRSSGETIQE